MKHARWTDRVLGRLLRPDVAEEVLGDLAEEWSGHPPGFMRFVRRARSITSILVYFVLPGLVSDGSGGIRHAVRRLRREPTFSAVTILAIMLGLGVNVFMLAVAEAMRS